MIKNNIIKIAIVGPEERKWTEEQKVKAKDMIKHILLGYYDAGIKISLVSGKCPKGGIDVWAEEIADMYLIDKDIKKSEVNKWNDSYDYELGIEGDLLRIRKHKGYRTRNLEIADECNVLYCIVPKADPPKPYEYPAVARVVGKNYCIHCEAWGHPRNGGCWTMKEAKALEKETHLIVIE